MFLLWQEAQLAMNNSLPAATVGWAEREAVTASKSVKTQQMRFNNISEVVDFLKKMGKNPLF
jgi:hypothetical protein